MSQEVAMIFIRPNFLDSPFFVDEVDNWHLLPGAPPEVVAEFEEFMRSDWDYGIKPDQIIVPSLLDDLDL